MTYHIAVNGAPQGPYTVDQLRGLNITPSTLVWNNSLTNWTPAGEVPELATYLFGGAQAPSTLPNGGFQNAQPIPSVPNQAQQTQQPLQPQEPIICPKTWLLESILCTLFCCLPLGIVAIIKACQVDSFWKAQQYQQAQQASQEAGKWTKWGFFIGIGVYLLYVLFILVAGGSGVFGSFGDL